MSVEAARELRRRIDASTAAAQVTVAPLIADTAAMTDEQASKLTALFDVFDPDGHAYSVGDVASPRRPRPERT